MDFRRLCAAVAALTLGAGNAFAGSNNAAPDPAANPDIATIPEAAVIDPRHADQIPLYHPETAHDIGGVAVIECKVSSPKGALRDCLTVSETPPRCFFGDAAGKLAEVGIIGAPTSLLDDPVQIGKVVRVKVTFQGASARSHYRC